MSAFTGYGIDSPNMAMTDWAVATADAGSGDPEYSIPRTDQGGSITVRIPLGTRPDPSGDGHLTVRDRERASRRTSGRRNYDSATQRISSDERGRQLPAGRDQRADVGLGRQRRKHAASRRTDHAGGHQGGDRLRQRPPYTLQFGMPEIAQGSPRYPAPHNAPTGDFCRTIVEGTWVRLDPAYDVDASGLPAWQKVIARTMQRKGAILATTQGLLGLRGNPMNRGAVVDRRPVRDDAGFSSAFPWSACRSCVLRRRRGRSSRGTDERQSVPRRLHRRHGLTTTLILIPGACSSHSSR